MEGERQDKRLQEQWEYAEVVSTMHFSQLIGVLMQLTLSGIGPYSLIVLKLPVWHWGLDTTAKYKENVEMS